MRYVGVLRRLPQAAALAAVLALLLGLYVNLAPFQFSNHRWLPDDNPTAANKKYLDDEFNRGESLLVVVSLKQNYFRPPLIAELGDVVQKFYQIADVNLVNSPLHAKFILKDADGGLHNISFEQALADGLLTLADYPARLRETPYWLKFIAESEDVIVIKVALSAVGGEKSKRFGAVFDAIGEVLDASVHFNDYGFAGEAELYYRTEQLSKRDLTQLSPLALILLALLLTLAYRSARYTLITVLVTGCVLLLMLNINQALGYSFTVISASLPILVMTVAMADSIHILRRWRARTSDSAVQMLRQCWNETWRPCLFTSATSSIGFGVFYLSELLPLKNFGVVAFISIALAYPVIMLVTFALLFALRPTVGTRAGKPNAAIKNCIAYTVRHKNAVVGASFAALFASAAAFSVAKYETNFLDVFFSADSATAKSFDLIDAKLSGSGSLDVVYKGEQANTFSELPAFEALTQQVQAANSFTEIRAVNSMLDPVAMVHRPLSDEVERLPTTTDGLAQELLFLEFSRNDVQTDVLSQFVDFDYANSRVAFSTGNMKSGEIRALINKLGEEFNRAPFDWFLTGANVYFYELNAFVIRAQFLSMLITGLFVWGFFIMQLGLRRGSIGMLASVIPIAVTLGVQIAARIPFDFSTVLVASICLGICIDDTIHFMHRLNAQDKKITFSEQLQRAASDIWQPVALTTAVLIAGFLVLLNSELVVVDRFAALTVFAIAMSLVTVLFVLPALLHLFSRAR